MAQGIIAHIKDWGINDNGKHKRSVKLEGDEKWYNTTNDAFAQAHKAGDSVTLDANEFPEGSGKYWFNRFGSAASAVQSNPSPQPSLTAPTVSDKDRSIFVQSIGKGWVGAEDESDAVEAKITFLWNLKDRLGDEPEEIPGFDDGPAF